jgi:type IV pilus assembly protein PilC
MPACSIIQCLDILQSQQENKNVKKSIKKSAELVEVGSTLADALKKFSERVSTIFLST